jgi:hypothetical protein
VIFLKYHQNPQVLKIRSIEKKERKTIEKRRKKKKRKKEKRKAPRVSTNKEKVNILRGEKHFNFKNIFLCDILPLQHTISKTLSKLIEKVFLTLFGPSFSLAIYMT